MAVAYLFLTLGALLILVFIRPALHLLRPDMGTPAEGSLPAVPLMATGTIPGTGGSPGPESRSPGPEAARKRAERLSSLDLGNGQERERVRELEERLAELQETVAALTARLAGMAGAEPGAAPRAGGRPPDTIADKALAGKAFRAYLDAALAGSPEKVAPGAAPAGASALITGDQRAMFAGIVPTAAPALVPAGTGRDPAPGEETPKSGSEGAGGLQAPPEQVEQGGRVEPGAGQELPGIMAAIRQAHARGESIESLARRFGRGKGEIALILNLHH
ncbi:MAG: hypothetical protein PWP70_854 [Moorella sp. (in: firmicutes)]|nr:hypothetical protein [Moorella sp. (in: firmicutes)]